MTALTRRTVLLAGAAALALPARGGEPGWIEVTGYARARGPADVEAARRRALADALLSAALAGGAELRGQSVLSKARLVSDVLVVRPTGRVLAHRVVSAAFDGTGWTLRIRARVGRVPASGHGGCGATRRLTVTALMPRVAVAAAAPAWAGPTAAALAEGLLRATAAHPAVATLRRLPRPLPSAADRAGERYRMLTRGAVTVPEGDHVLDIGIAVAAAVRGPVLSAELRLDGPLGEAWDTRHRAPAPEPGPSPLARSAALVTPPRAARAGALVRGAADALRDLLDRAACRDVAARLSLAGGRLVAPVGSDHGLDPASLAYTPGDASASGLLEVVELGHRRVVLRPADPQRQPAEFAGRIVQFVQFGQALP